MSIKIVLPESNGDYKPVLGTKVYTESGEEIKNISRIEIDMNPGDIMTAKLTVLISDISNFDGLRVELSEETKEQLSLLGYVKA